MNRDWQKRWQDSSPLGLSRVDISRTWFWTSLTLFLLFYFSMCHVVLATETGAKSTVKATSQDTKNVAVNSNKALSKVQDSTDKITKIVPDKSFKWQEHRDILPYEYAQVTEQPAPVFRTAWQDISDKRPLRQLFGGFIWVSLETPLPIKSGKFTWYNINQNEFVQSNYLSFFKVSTFKGVDLKSHPLDGTYGWLVLDTYTSTVPGRQEYIDGELVEKHTLVKVLETKMINGQKWLKLAKGKWVDGRRVALITDPIKPSKIPPGVKWIDINLYEQVLEAFEGDTMVYATLISSGLPEFETPTGIFRIWGKRRMAKMSGGKKDVDYYFLEDVPYHMYFSQGIAMHGAYWHDNFGMKQSHGCVNLAPRDAFWLFHWTTPRTFGNRFIKASPSNPGTYVFVHY